MDARSKNYEFAALDAHPDIELRLNATTEATDFSREAVDLEIRHGEFVVFVGPSGCGKSTLLRMIAGLETPTSGDVKIDGERVNDVSAADRGCAMVFQSYALYPHMTVFDNMAYGLKIRGLPRDLDLAIAILDLDLGQAGFVEQFGQLAHQRGVDIHAGLAPVRLAARGSKQALRALSKRHRPNCFALTRDRCPR